MSQRQAAAAHLNPQKYLDARSNTKRLSQRKLTFATITGQGNDGKSNAARGGGSQNRSPPLHDPNHESTSKGIENKDDSMEITTITNNTVVQTPNNNIDKASTTNQHAEVSPMGHSVDKNIISTSKKCFPTDMPIDLEPMDSWSKD
jgi:hypothetical protein